MVSHRGRKRGLVVLASAMWAAGAPGWARDAEPKGSVGSPGVEAPPGHAETEADSLVEGVLDSDEGDPASEGASDSDEIPVDAGGSLDAETTIDDPLIAVPVPVPVGVDEPNLDEPESESVVLPPPIEEKQQEKPTVKTSFTEDLEIRYWQVPNRITGFEDQPVLDYVEQVNRINGMVGVGPVSVGIQLDQVALLGNRYYLDDVLQVERDLIDTAWTPFPTADFYINPEKAWLKYESPLVTAVIGDFYAAFGRGIALNVNRNVDIDIDTSIRGVKTMFRPGMWDITAVMGQLNRQQVWQDNPNTDLAGDRLHAVAGARVERFGLGPVNVGAHVTMFDFVNEVGWKAGFDELGTPLDVVVGGATIEWMGLGPFDTFFEADVMTFPSGELFADGSVNTGYALYGAITGYLGPTVWLLEGKRYLDAERMNSPLITELYEVGTAPTLEYDRAITEDSSAAVNSNNSYGARLRLDVAAKPGRITPYASFAVFRDLELGTLHFNRSAETILHPMIGIEWIEEPVAIIWNAGWRTDIRDDKEHGFDRQIHTDIIANIALPKEFSLNLSGGWEQFHWGVNAFQQSDYFEMETAFSVGYASWVTFTWYTDYTTNPLVVSSGNLEDAWYGAAEIQVKPHSSLTLKAFYGAYKAGIRCSGGQCRVLPGFEGARLTATANF